MKKLINQYYNTFTDNYELAIIYKCIQLYNYIIDTAVYNLYNIINL